MHALGKSMSGHCETDPKKLGLYVGVLSRGYQLSWGAGIVGTVMGMVIMLMNMTHPSKIGPGMAVSLITVLYGAGLAEFVFNVLQASLMKNAIAPSGGDPNPVTAQQPPHRSMLGLGSTTVCLMVLLFLILTTSLG